MREEEGGDVGAEVYCGHLGIFSSGVRIVSLV